MGSTARKYLNPPASGGGFRLVGGSTELTAGGEKQEAKRQAVRGDALGGHRFTALNRGRIAARGVMNQTEQAYACQLAAQKLAGEIADWWFEPMSLRLTHPETGQPARVTPDFMVLMPDGLVYLDDAKGTGVDNDAQRVAMKCAAELYPLWRFRIVKRQTKKQGGGWKVTEL